ncbi:MAG: DUF3854 domain-containing protein [Planctomycetia bacterium]
MLEASAVEPAVRDERGHRTLTVAAEAKRLGFSARQARVPALLIPLHGVSGEVVSYQLRPDVPRVGSDGKTVKYETPGRSHMVLDVPPRARPWLGNPERPLVVTEGSKKADSGVSRGLCTIDLLGVWNWRGTNEHGGKTVLADWESIALKGRQVYVVFDSDVATKPAVRQALLRLKAFLESRGAKVAVVYLPPGPGATKVGLDDYFAAGHTVADLLRCAESNVRPPADEGEDDAGPYAFEGDGIYLVSQRNDGVSRVRLTNFVARIVCETTLDDGAEERKVFRLAARIGEHECEFDVSAGDFEDMRWPAVHVGAGATLLPVANVERHVRAAIQTTSGVTAPRRRVHVHTGWVRRGAEWLFLHAGGALGKGGPVADVEVRLEPQLAGFELPAVGTADEVVTAVRAALGYLDVGPDRITLPLFAAVWRAVIDACDFAIHLAGGSGVFKTAIAALLQQFFGAKLDARNLPGSWSSTANALEALAFYAKDVILVVDDFAPNGGTLASGRLHQTAERVFRAQGNRSGRGRCGPDGTLRATRAPRGLITSTGEETPRGASLRARFLTLDVAPGDIDRQRLTLAQEDASRGLFALALAAFVQWLAGRLEDVRARQPTRVTELRESFSREGRHRRVPGLVGDLHFGLEVFTEFAVDQGCLSTTEAQALRDRSFCALSEAAATQEREQKQSEPGPRFLTLLRSAILSGAAHLTDELGNMPANARAWGWRATGVEKSSYETRQRWDPQGIHVGWVTADGVYLEAEAALKGAHAVGSTTGDPLSILASTLGRRLKEAGLLASTAPDGVHIEVQRRLSGARPRVLHLATETLMPQDEDGASEDEGAREPEPAPAHRPPAPPAQPSPQSAGSDGSDDREDFRFQGEDWERRRL